MGQTKEGAAKVAAKYYGFSIEEYLKRIENESYCNKCKTWKPKIKFCIDKSRINGLHKNCQDCRWKNGGKRGKSIKGRPSAMKGKHFTGKALDNIRVGVRRGAKKRIGEKKIYTKEGYERLLKSNRRPRPSMAGILNHNWKGGISKGRGKRYYSFEYKNWRRQVFDRDKYTCQDCIDNTGGNLEAHHIKEVAKYPDLVFEVSNGITLCKECHEKRHFNPNSTRNMARKKKGIKLKFNG